MDTLVDNMEVIKQVEAALPDSYKTAMFRIKEFKIPLYRFLEEQLVNFMNDNNVNNIVKYIEEVLDKKEQRIDFDAIPNIVNKFQSSCDSFRETIMVGMNSMFNVKQYMIDYIASHYYNDESVKYPIGLDENGVMQYKNITLEELYTKCLEKEYRLPTIQEKQEYAIGTLKAIATKEIMESVIPKIEKTVEEYIANVVPNMIDQYFNINIGAETYTVEDFIQNICDYQYSLIKVEDKKENEEQEKKVLENNSINSNPNIVGEISLVRGDNENLYATTELPVIKSSNPDEEETASLLSNYSSIASITSDDYYSIQLNNLKKAIDKTTNEHDLDAKVKIFNKIAEEAMYSSPSISIQTLIASIKDLITKKTNNLIKISSNSEDYIDVLFNKINTLKTEVLTYTNTDEFAKLIGELTSIENDMYQKGISDLNLESSIVLLRSVANERRLIVDATIPDQDREVIVKKNELDEALRSIQSDLLSIEHDPNNLSNYIGTQVRVSNNIESAKYVLDNASRDGLLTDDDKAYYTNKLEKYRSALKSEEKIGYGTR